MASRYKAELGQAIKRRRLELGLTQKELAERAHYQEPQTVSRWERGENLPNDLEVVATALEWTLSDLVAGIQPPDRRTARRWGGVDDPDGNVPDPFAESQAGQLDRIEDALDAVLRKMAGLEDAVRLEAVRAAAHDAEVLRRLEEGR